VRLLARRNGSVVRVNGFQDGPVAVDVRPPLPTAVTEEEALCGSVATDDRGSEHSGNPIVLTDRQRLSPE